MSAILLVWVPCVVLMTGVNHETLIVSHWEKCHMLWQKQWQLLWLNDKLLLWYKISFLIWQFELLCWGLLASSMQRLSHSLSYLMIQQTHISRPKLVPHEECPKLILLTVISIFIWQNVIWRHSERSWCPIDPDTESRNIQDYVYCGFQWFWGYMYDKQYSQKT